MEIIRVVGHRTIIEVAHGRRHGKTLVLATQDAGNVGHAVPTKNPFEEQWENFFALAGANVVDPREATEPVPSQFPVAIGAADDDNGGPGTHLQSSRQSQRGAGLMGCAPKPDHARFQRQNFLRPLLDKFRDELSRVQHSRPHAFDKILREGHAQPAQARVGDFLRRRQVRGLKIRQKALGRGQAISVE